MEKLIRKFLYSVEKNKTSRLNDIFKKKRYEFPHIPSKPVIFRRYSPYIPTYFGCFDICEYLDFLQTYSRESLIKNLYDKSI